MESPVNFYKFRCFDSAEAVAPAAKGLVCCASGKCGPLPRERRHRLSGNPLICKNLRGSLTPNLTKKLKFLGGTPFCTKKARKSVPVKRQSRYAVVFPSHTNPPPPKRCMQNLNGYKHHINNILQLSVPLFPINTIFRLSGPLPLL